MPALATRKSKPLEIFNVDNARAKMRFEHLPDLSENSRYLRFRNYSLHNEIRVLVSGQRFDGGYTEMDVNSGYIDSHTVVTFRYFLRNYVSRDFALGIIGRSGCGRFVRVGIFQIDGED